MSCRFVEDEKCFYPFDENHRPGDGVSLSICEFCLKARTQHITQLNPIRKDHGKLYEELNELREEKRKRGEMSK